MDIGAVGELGANAAKTATKGTGKGEGPVCTNHPKVQCAGSNARGAIYTKECVTSTRLVIVSVVRKFSTNSFTDLLFPKVKRYKLYTTQQYITIIF